MAGRVYLPCSYTVTTTSPTNCSSLSTMFVSEVGHSVNSQAFMYGTLREKGNSLVSLYMWYTMASEQDF
jgi:hypothetical protein